MPNRVDFKHIIDNWKPARLDTYDVFFTPTPEQMEEGETDSPFNIKKIGQNFYSFPHTSVEEHLVTMEWDKVTLLDGTTLTYPGHVSSYGYITLTFQDNCTYDLHFMLKEWILSVKKDYGVYDDIVKVMRKVNIERHNIHGEDVIFSSYGVLPPDNLRASNSNQSDWVENSFSFQVVAIYNHFERVKKDSPSPNPKTDGLALNTLSNQYKNFA